MNRQADHGHFDILIRGGTIVTAETARPLIEDGLIGVRHGRIALMDTSHALDREPTSTKVIDGRGHAILPGFVNVHTHAALILVRGMSEDMGFAPAYMPNVPQGPMLSPDDARALARLGALELVRFGTTLINDSYVYPHSALPGMGEVGLRVYACNRIHDVDFAALPAAPELALICSPPPTVPGLVAELGARGTRAVVVLTPSLAERQT